MRKTPWVTASLLLAVPLVLAGCSAPAPESRLQEYQGQAEAIHAGMLERVPDNSAVRTTSQSQFGERSLFGNPERDVAFWRTASTIEVSEGAPAQAAAAVGESLLEEQWTAESTVNQGGTMPFTKVYRLGEADGEWIVEIAWSVDEGSDGMVLSVQSPITVRGATPE